MIEKTALIVVGTRPEVIKLAPVVREFHTRPGWRVILCSTGQQMDLVDSTLQSCSLDPNIRLDVMVPGQSLSLLGSKILAELGRILSQLHPTVLVVQGDTTTAAMSAIAGFLSRVPVAHVEAGLRSGNLLSPFPEEFNRRIIATCSTFHFAPTPSSLAALIDEGVPRSSVHLTGNTVVDNLHWVLGQKSPKADEPGEAAEYRQILVTCHRRESFGEPIRQIFRGVRTVVEAHNDVEALVPVHPNPMATEAAHEVLGNHPRIRLVQPLEYQEFIRQLAQSCLVISDSGGVQEEAPALGVPVIVARDVTERSEGVDLGVSWLVGTRSDSITAAANSLLDPTRLQQAPPTNLYGDGKAAVRIVRVLTSELDA